MVKMKYQVEENDVRLDNYLAKITEESRSQITKMIKAGEVLVNSNKVKAGYLLKENDIIEITFGQRVLTVKVLDVREHALKADAASLYEIIEQKVVPSTEQ